jgi:DNA-binding transcriptional ArsR family regulator
MLSKAQKIFFALSDKRTKLYELVMKEELNIAEITRRLGQTYQVILKDLKILEDAEMISKEERFRNGVRQIIVKGIPFGDETIYKKIYELRLQEINEMEDKP